ncbi:hypothetical protein [Viscerimonas tarda]
MGYIKEPEGIDFVINGKPLTEDELKGISEFIKADKAKRNNRTSVVQKTKRRKGLYA